MIEYIHVTQWYDGAEVGSVWEITNPIIPPNLKSNVYVVKRKDNRPGTRWISKDCGYIITKETHPEFFL